jgi:ABC-type transport system involved in multi-copper enzyme maturation permease subunit
MLGAFSSELVKLRRRSFVLWGFGGALVFAVLATVFTIERATKTINFNAGGDHHGILIAVLELPNGLVHGVVDVSALLGIVSLCVFAGAFATEYSQGTMRNLLVREPRRAQLLSGKFLALVLFMTLVIIVAIGASVAVAFILAPGKGITTTAWTSSTGINDLLQAILHVFITSVGYGVFGTALGLLLRSPGLAIGIGVAYFLPGEAIIVNAIWTNGQSWLPGQLLFAVSHGGSGPTSYSHALLFVAIYAVVVAAGTLALFQRRDA